MIYANIILNLKTTYKLLTSKIPLSAWMHFSGLNNSEITETLGLIFRDL